VLRITITRGAVGQVLDVDALLVATGRRANTAGLGLDAAGVKVDEAGRVVVNDYLQTTNRRIYAAGDVCLPWQFTHAADASARLVLRNALFAGRARASRLLVPRAIFTDPEVAAIGLAHRAAADAAGVRVRTFDVSFDDVDRAMAEGHTRGFARVVVSARSDRIVGATIVCARAGELVSELAVAMKAGLGLSGLASVIHPYPGYADALKRAADAYNRTRLTPRVAGLMRAWLAARRRI
jgi:pyruvate/2-oxoglutarate dehydrogenase complex dihydrolipoamide dehydrogenase (E3) component